jgi:hypothetical protein
MTRRQAGVAAGVVLGALLVGCQPTAPERASTEAMTQKGGYKVVSEIGPEGGMMAVGPYTLVVPPGALSQTVYLSMSQDKSGEWPVSMGPEGTQFIFPVQLQFDASAEANPNGLTVGWWNPSTSAWVDQVTHHDGATIWANISHFSKFILH